MNNIDWSLTMTAKIYKKDSAIDDNGDVIDTTYDFRSHKKHKNNHGKRTLN